MATARFKNAEGTVMITDFRLWERESELGTAHRGRIEIDSIKKDYVYMMIVHIHQKFFLLHFQYKMFYFLVLMSISKSIQ